MRILQLAVPNCFRCDDDGDTTFLETLLPIQLVVNQKRPGAVLGELSSACIGVVHMEWARESPMCEKCRSYRLSID